MCSKSLGPTLQPMYVLEESFYPDTWRDDSRMGVLLCEFRTRSVNPENYDSKMKFWKQMITNYCERKGSGLVSIVELKRVFKRKGTVPYCLQAVLDDMLNEGHLMGKDEFRRVPQESWTGWAVDVLMKRPLGWGFGKVKEKLVGNKVDESAEFVCLDVIKKQCDMLEKVLQEKNKYNVLVSWSDIVQLAKNSGLTEDGFDLVLHYMACNQRVFVEKNQTENDGQRKTLLKFAAIGAKSQPITDIERSIFNLEQTEHNLMTVIEKMEQDVASAMSVVKENIREGRKQVAKSNLKKKHLLERNLEKKMTVLDNVQIMLSKIHDSQSDRNVIEAYKIGSNALKNAYANSGITIDNVDDTLAEMKEIMDQHDEMQTMIGATQNTDVDDLELEQELSDLIDMKLAENNIMVHPLTVPETPVLPPAPPSAPVNNTFTQPTVAQSHNFDTEIEKRLAALRMDIPSPPSDTSIIGNTSMDKKNFVPSASG
ncbi:charged multivesicular body protein 7 [Toxorhynchites rutilus septentrionalis]|uniref:charged multivesicular body protein 7 n=1 Tax=Toxorhynchites rutilus septentrionalis TaxID=329112 RepID=UPI00247A4ABB|nr:charged multivesicular body protein 7 [Toxorhynchites rutilus septentrionalis]